MYQCPVCWEEGLDGDLVAPECGHVFHSFCINSQRKCPICRRSLGRLITLYINQQQSGRNSELKVSQLLKELGEMKEKAAVEASKASILQETLTSLTANNQKYELDLEFFKNRTKEALTELSEIKENFKKTEENNRKEREKLLKDMQILKSSTAFSSSLIQKLKSELLELKKRTEKSMALSLTNEGSRITQASSSLSPELQSFHLSAAANQGSFRRQTAAPPNLSLSHASSRPLNRNRLMNCTLVDAADSTRMYDDRGRLVKRIVDSAGNPFF